nr:M1 family aminopeptidase [Priestia taiwanensis]
MLGVDESDELLQEVFGIAERALTYFSTTFGPYPHNELDIILDGPAMEYPGIVTVSSAKEVPKEFLVEAIVHEIAHQWFYGMVTNDPYFHAWIDEGMTSLATDMFLEKNLSKEHYGSFLETNGVRPSNLSLNDYEGTLIFAYIYGQVPMKINEIFDGYSGRETAEAFLKEYVRLYQYKEIDTDEFVRFIKHYLQLEDDSLFEGWLKLK